MTISDLRSAVAENPDLVDLVNRLSRNQVRLNRLLYDLGRLNEAIVQRALMLQAIDAPTGSRFKDLADSCIQLLGTVSTFIDMATTPVEERIDDVATVYQGLMSRIMKT